MLCVGVVVRGDFVDGHVVRFCGSIKRGIF